MKFLCISAVIVLLLGFLAITTSAQGQGCICTMEYRPVCGTDGNTYGNSCQLNCAGVVHAHAGECRPRAACRCSRLG